MAFSQLQTLIPDSENKRKQLAEGVRHMEFVAKLYRKQVEGGRVFVHENPAHAKSWGLPIIKRMMRGVGVDIVEADQCMFGMKTWGKNRAQLMLAKNPTRFMTNSRAIGQELKRKCDGSHEHQPLADGRARDAARYPPALCRALCRGIAKEKMQRECGVRAVLEIGEGMYKRVIDSDDHHDREESDVGRYLTDPGRPTPPGAVKGRPTAVQCLNRLTEYKNKSGGISSVLAWDDLTGMKLDAGQVKEERAKEVQYLRDKRVYDKIPRSQALRNKWNIIQTRWIDINKGDDENPKYRSRMVGK